MRTTTMTILGLILSLLSTGCGKTDDSRPDGAPAEKPPSNHIELSDDIRTNLGITWATAREGRLEQRISIPGELVPPPDRQWVMRAPFAGTLTNVAARWTPVKAGDVVADLVSSGLADLQSEMVAALRRNSEALQARRLERAAAQAEKVFADALARAAGDAVKAQTAAAAVLDKARTIAAAAEKRVSELASLTGDNTVSQATLLAAKKDVLELRRGEAEAERAVRTARIESQELALKAVRARGRVAEAATRDDMLTTRINAASAAFDQLMGTLAGACGVPIEQLTRKTNGTPHWQTMRSIELRAPAAGVVAAVHATSRTWIDGNAPILDVQDPSILMFRALLPEGDAASLPLTAEVEIEVPGVDEPFPAGAANLRPVADAATRSVFVEALIQNPKGRLRAGSSATGLLTVSISKSDEILIPISCVVRDGLQSIVFVRDAVNKNEVTRVRVALGARSSGWVEVVAGVGAKDELVKDGVHQLRQSGLGKSASAGGHFHSDGTWHGDH